MRKGEKAVELFMRGYNCAQAVAIAFCEETELTEEMTAKLVSGFGGGMGRMREVCGAVSGMVFVLSILRGYSDPKDNQGKKLLYEEIQKLASVFKEEKGTIICRELIKGTGADSSPTPELRNERYYSQRKGCLGCVECAAGILEEYLLASEPV